MRALTPSQSASVSSELLTLATLVEITLNDGTIVKLTDHDRDLDDYVSTFGLDASAVAVQLGGAGQTGTVTLLPDRGEGGGIPFQAVSSGLLDTARLRVYWSDYTIKPLDPLLICTGQITSAKYGDQETIEISYTTILGLDHPICGDTLSKTCRADFGDTKCKIPLANLIAGPKVYSAIDSISFKISRDEQTPPGFYNNGTVYFRNGLNKGLGYEILTVLKADQNGRETVVLKVPLHLDAHNGDDIWLYPGCDKYFNSGCAYWNNQANFQGEPFSVNTDNVIPPNSASAEGGDGGSDIATGMPAAQNWLLTQYIRIGFGVDVTFSAGTRLTDTAPFTDTLIPYDAYSAIVNLLGGAEVVIIDGNLRPVALDRQAQLSAAGWTLNLNLNASSVYIDPNNLDDEVSALFHG